jgi:hypothetical protein
MTVEKMPDDHHSPLLHAAGASINPKSGTRHPINKLVPRAAAFFKGIRAAGDRGLGASP